MGSGWMEEDIRGAVFQLRPILLVLLMLVSSEVFRSRGGLIGGEGRLRL